MDDVSFEIVETQLAQAYTRALQPAAREHIHAALLEPDAEVPKGLAECPSCGRVGLPDRVLGMVTDISRINDAESPT
jgi:hypothetical protein